MGRDDKTHDRLHPWALAPTITCALRAKARARIEPEGRARAGSLLEGRAT